MNKVYHADQHDLDLKKIGSTIKKAAKNVNTGIIKAKKNVVKEVKKAAEKAGYLPKLAAIAIFSPVMASTLKSKGIPPSKDLAELAEQFYLYVIKKQKYVAKKNIAPALIAMIPMIVEEIIKYFKQLKDKKDAGKELTDEEQKALDATKKLADEVEAADEGNKTNDYIKYALIAVAVIAILIMLKNRK